MAEILGVLASATQLAQYAIQISSLLHEIKKRVQSAPELQEYSVKIQQLLETTHQVQQIDRWVQSTSIAKHLDTCRAEAQALQILLEQVLADYTTGFIGRRYLKAARGTKETKIASGFERLEQEKTSLIVSILFYNASTTLSSLDKLESIQSGVLTLMHRPHEIEKMNEKDYKSVKLNPVEDSDEEDNTVSAKEQKSSTCTIDMPKHPGAERVSNAGDENTQNHGLRTMAAISQPLNSPSVTGSPPQGALPPQQPPGWGSPPYFHPQHWQQFNAPSYHQTTSNPPLHPGLGTFENSWTGCEAIGKDNSEAETQMQCGHFGPVPGVNKYKDCKASSGGIMCLGSAVGEGIPSMDKWWSGARAKKE